MRWLLAPLAALSLLCGSPAVAQVHPHPSWPEIWYNPFGPADFLDMWTEDAPWPHAAKRVGYVTLVHWWLRQATDQQIMAIVDFAQAHRMKLDLDVEPILRYDTDTCGHTEGYTAPLDLPGTLAVLQRLNIRIDAITMDEPLWFGHYNPDPQDCDLSIPELVHRIRVNMAPIMAAYPGARLQEYEPIPGLTNASDWTELMSGFHAAIAAALGSPIRSVILDVNWDTPAWQDAMPRLRAFTDHENTGLGVIYDASTLDPSNAAWVAHAVSNFETVEGTLGIVPDLALFTSWTQFPNDNMPETTPTTLTWLIDNYFRERTAIQAQFLGAGARGTLKTQSGKPMVNATVNGYVPGVDFNQPLPTKTVQGVVPSNAVQGILGFRLNTECGCQGQNDVLVGQLQYQETQGGNSSYSFMVPPVDATFNGAIITGELVNGAMVTRVIASPTQAVYPNSGMFPVTANAQFSFTVPASTIGGVGWFGNAILVWIDGNGNGISRVTVEPDPGKRLVSSTTTAADGTFGLTQLPRVGPGAAPISIEYAGDATHRAVVWTPLQ